MRKIILNVAVSLDGLIEGVNGEYDWCFTDQDYNMTAFLNDVDTILIGRKSYELLKDLQANSWPDKQMIVFSQTLLTENEGCQVISNNIKQEVSIIKQAQGKNIWLFGGANLTTSLLNEGLVDELVLSIHPIILGKGKPLFSFHNRIKLQLLHSQAFSSGLVQLHYKLNW